MSETARPYDVYARLEDSMGVMAVALAQWETRDGSRPQPEIRRAANTAMDAIDQMLRELYAFRSRLVSEIRAADDVTAARVDAMLRDRGEAMADDGEGVVLAWCKGCRHATASIPCELCGGPSCAGCGRCPPCDGPVPDEEE